MSDSLSILSEMKPSRVLSKTDAEHIHRVVRQFNSITAISANIIDQNALCSIKHDKLIKLMEQHKWYITIPEHKSYFVIATSMDGTNKVNIPSDQLEAGAVYASLVANALASLSVVTGNTQLQLYIEAMS